VKCIKVLGQGKRKIGTIHSWIVGSVQTATPKHKQKNRINLKKKILKGDIVLCLIIRIKKSFLRIRYSEYISYNTNSVVLYKLNKSFLFTRIYGCVSLELRRLNLMKLISLADGVF
jgi:ribosomal protein L14